MFPFFKVVVGLEVAAFIFTLLGFAVPMWVTAHHLIPIVIYSSKGETEVKMDHLGLWQACGGGYGCIPLLYNIPGFMNACRVFMTLALIGSVVSLICTVLFLCAQSLRKNRKFRIVILAATITTVVSIIISVSVWSGTIHYTSYLSFAFAAACIAIIVHSAKGGLFIWHMTCATEI